MDDLANSVEAEELFPKRSSSNILSDPRILEHLRIVAEEAQSSEKNEEDTETEMAVNKRELAEKIANYNKRNQGAFRLVMKEDLHFEGALRFYFEDANEKITKAIRLTNRSLVSEILPMLIEKFKPDLDQTSLLCKAKLYEVHDEDDREADEICLDPSDYPLDIALSARRLPRFVLRLEYDKPIKTSSPQPNGIAKQQEQRKISLNSSVTSVKSAASDGSSTSGSTQMSKDSHHSTPLTSKFSSSKSSNSSGTPTSSRKNQEDRPSSSNSDRAKNFFKNASLPRSTFGMFFDGVSGGSSSNQDRSAHQAHKAVRVKHQRKRSFGSLLKLKKSAAAKKTVELSTNQLAPGVLKVFGGHVSPGSNYKSVRATELTTAAEIVKESLERYSLDSSNSNDYVLCDVIGFFAGADGTKKENSEQRSSESEKWITEYSRVVGDQEKPLVLQQLWKPITGFSRRFELRKKVETQESSFFQARGSIAVMKAASVREVKMPPVVKEAQNPKRGVGAFIHFESFGTEEGSSTSRPSVILSPFLPPTDTPYLLLIRGYAIPEDHLYHRLDEQIALIGRHSDTPGEGNHGDYDEHNPDISLFAPDVLPQHCVLSKKVEADGDFDLEEECDVNFVVCLDPNRNASVKINGVPISSPIKLSPGDLISLGAHYVYMFKDPTQVLDSSLQLIWMDALQKFHEMSKNFNRSVSETDTINSETSLERTQDQNEDEKTKLRLIYSVENEDKLIDIIMNLSQEDVYELTPAYLLILCIEHSSKHHTEIQTRRLMVKISNAIQSVAWERTTEMSNTIEKDTPPDKAMSELLPQLNPVIFWMANSMEMFHFLRSNVTRYLGDASLISSLGDEALTRADDELLVCLEEVVMYTFQQTVYHLTKVLYVALPVILDTNPFQFDDDDDSNDKKRPQEIDMVVSIFNQTYNALVKCSVHNEIVHQLFAYLFFFTNASLFNTLMERGAGGKFYRWAKGAQIRGNLDALESWASQVGLQEEYVHYLTRLSTAADLLATPKVQLLQADWIAIRRDFPALNAAQVQQILGEYQLGPGKSRPRGWFPPPEEVEPALRTADILLSFADHPPLSLPTSNFILDLKTGPSSALFYEYLDFIKSSSNSGFKIPDWKTYKSSNKIQRPEPEVPSVIVPEEVIRFSAFGSPDDLDDIDVPSVTVSPPTSKSHDDHHSKQQVPLPATHKDHGQVDKPKRAPVKTHAAASDRKDKNTPKHETRQDRPAPVPAPRSPTRNSPDLSLEASHSSKPRSRSPQPTPRGHKKEDLSKKVRHPRPHGVPSSAGNPVAIPPRGRTSGGTTPTESPRESLSGYHVRSSSGGSSTSSLSSFGTRDENQNMSKPTRKESDSHKDDGTRWVDINGSGTVESLDGLSVLPENEDVGRDRESVPKGKEKKHSEVRVTDKVKFMSHLQRNDVHRSNLADDVEPGSGSHRKLEGMRDGDDPQDDVFIVELEKKSSGIGLGLIDGLYTPLRSPGIYVRTLLEGGAAEKDGRLRLGDRILAVNGTSLVGADYQSAMQEIREAGDHLSFLVAKSDIHVAMKITASSC